MEHPLLYQINTRCWLGDLSDKFGHAVTLSDVPESEFALWQRYGFTHIWLMGVWTTGPRARQLAIYEPNLRQAYNTLVPSWTEKDIGGSPYSIAAYEVPAAMGGDAGLKKFREELHRRGMKLILDFVPNHVGFDHPWCTERPEFFVQSPAFVEGTFSVEIGDEMKWIAHGKDPHFYHWTDVAQLDYRKTATREAVQELLLSVAARCDGVRCDMAMLLVNEVFAGTWSHLPHSGPRPKTEFWEDAIPAVKQAHPDFLFIAEVYWGMEGRLQYMGFDYTYDKSLYDDIEWRNTGWTQKRLLETSPKYTASSVHFLENHDENRVAATLSLEEHRAAALLIMGLPGMRFLHDGQLTGATFKIPVQLSRRPVEPVQPKIQAFYDLLLTTLKKTSVGRGKFQLLTPKAAWADNPTGQNFIIVQWQGDSSEFDLVVVNLAPHCSQCFVPLSGHVSANDWQMQDLLGNERHERVGRELVKTGLYLDVPAHAAQLFHFTPLTRPAVVVHSAGTSSSNPTLTLA
jgi:hypothetical protein